MISLQEILEKLKTYDGRKLKIMEVCGTHTAAIFKNGIRDLISPNITLLSGPGCPVCVTSAAYIDRAIALAKTPQHVVLTFGDMLKVTGSTQSFSEAKADGAKVEMMYSPFEALEKAKAHPENTYVLAAVGFETTAPVYARLLSRAIDEGIKNIKLLTDLKTITPALDWISHISPSIDGYICPGHTAVITGTTAYSQLAKKHHRPFVVTGFEGEHILVAIYDIVCQIQSGKAQLHNLYQNAVHVNGNQEAKALLEKYFDVAPAFWRGIGSIDQTGLFLKEQYAEFDAGKVISVQENKSCACGSVMLGQISPNECPMFGTACTPTHPQGACMVSFEGACGIWYRNRR
ncbi:MAG: hydrogenase formation protein HypD [Hyphomonadaceae bacterium]|nr:hydrogenase formation protein HypD [Clostridia bacterium]